jgi:hypothetical protein
MCFQLVNNCHKRWWNAQLLVHKKCANKLYKKTEQITKICEERDNVLGICIDSTQNAALPCIPVKDSFITGSCGAPLFRVQDVKNNKAAFFCYHDDKSSKDPNEIYFFLSDCLEKDMPENIMQLHIFCDGCTVECHSRAVNVACITEHQKCGKSDS